MKKTEIGGWYRLSLPSPDRLVIHVTNASVLHLQKWLASEIGQTEINFYLSMLSGFSFTMPEKGKPCGFNDALVPAKSDTGWSAWQFQLPVFPSGDEEWAMTPTQDGSIQSIALILTALSSYEAKAAAAEQLMLVTRVYIPNPSSSFGTNLVIGVCDRMIRLLQCRMVGEKCVELDRVKATVSACSEHMLPKRPYTPDKIEARCFGNGTFHISIWEDTQSMTLEELLADTVLTKGKVPPHHEKNEGVQHYLTSKGKCTPDRTLLLLCGVAKMWDTAHDALHSLNQAFN